MTIPVRHSSPPSPHVPLVVALLTAAIFLALVLARAIRDRKPPPFDTLIVAALLAIAFAIVAHAFLT